MITPESLRVFESLRDYSPRELEVLLGAARACRFAAGGHEPGGAEQRIGRHTEPGRRMLNHDQRHRHEEQARRGGEAGLAG